MKLGVNLMNLNDWSAPVFSNLARHARRSSQTAGPNFPVALGPAFDYVVSEGPQTVSGGGTLTNRDGELRLAGATSSTVIDWSTPARQADPFHKPLSDALGAFDGTIRLMDLSGVFSAREGDVEFDNGHHDVPTGIGGVQWSEDWGSRWSTLAEFAARYPTWPCIPSRANSAQAAAMGRAIGATAQHPVTIEFSNEMWNRSFPQSTLLGDGDDWEQRLFNYLTLALDRTNAFLRGFRQVNTTVDVYRIACWQLGGDGGPLWWLGRDRWNNNALTSPRCRQLLAEFDDLGVGVYFGHRTLTDIPTRDELLADVAENRGALQVARAIVEDVNRDPRPTGRPMRLRGYEGGQSYWGNIEAQVSPQMGEATHAHLTLCNEFLDELCYYALVAESHPGFGSWGAVRNWRSMDDPKWQAILAWRLLTGGGGGGARGGGAGGGGGTRTVEERLAVLEAGNRELSAQLTSVAGGLSSVAQTVSTVAESGARLSAQFLRLVETVQSLEQWASQFPVWDDEQ